MKIYFFLIISTVILFSCKESDKISIKGNLKGAENTQIFLTTTKDGVVSNIGYYNIKLDSIISKNGEFQFTTQLCSFKQCYLHFERGGVKIGSIEFFPEDKDIVMKGSLSNPQIQGSFQNDLLKDIKALIRNNYDKSIFEQYQIKEWIVRHINKDVAMFALAKLTQDERIHLEYRILKDIEDKVPQIKKASSYYKYFRRVLDSYSNMQEGLTLTGITFKDKGKDLKIEDLRGKYTLVYRWNALHFLRYNDIERITSLKKLQEKHKAQLNLITFQDYFSNDRSVSACKDIGISWPNIDAEPNYKKLEKLVKYSKGEVALINPEGKLVCKTNDIDLIDRVITNRIPLEQGYVIRGQVLGKYDGEVKILYRKEGESKVSVLHSTNLNKGYFEFRGFAERPIFCNIQIENSIFWPILFIDNSNIDITIRVREKHFIREGKYILMAMTSDNTIYGGKANEEFKALNSLYSNIKCNLPGFKKWIKDHSDSFVTLYCLDTYMNEKIPVNDLFEIIKFIPEKFHNTAYYKSLLEKVERKSKLQIGNVAPEFILPDKNGKQVSLKDFRGKYVLLDFWASWCGPCKAEIPIIKEAHETYKNKELVVIGISSDRKRKAWLKAVEHEKMTWIQLNCSGSSVIDCFGVSGIPHIVLLDKKGRIVAKGIRGKAILGEIENLIEK